MLVCWSHVSTWDSFRILREWGPCSFRHGIQNSMETILACHPALSTEWLPFWQLCVDYDICSQASFFFSMAVNWWQQNQSQTFSWWYFHDKVSKHIRVLLEGNAEHLEKGLEAFRNFVKKIEWQLEIGFVEISITYLSSKSLRLPFHCFPISVLFFSPDGCAMGLRAKLRWWWSVLSCMPSHTACREHVASREAIKEHLWLLHFSEYGR